MKQAERAAEAVDGQLRQLSETVDLINEKQAAAAAAGDAIERDAFLRSSAFVVDNLNSLAIDLSRLIEREVPQSVWRAYNKGDRGVFARRIAGRRQQKDLRLIQRRYEEDRDFRQYVTRFIGEFDKLLAEARDLDYQNLLRTTFLTADVGKLYLLLCRAIGHEQ